MGKSARKMDVVENEKYEERLARKGKANDEE